MNKDLYYQYNPWWESGYEPTFHYPRENYQNQLIKQLDNRAVIFLTGLRRVGKTTLMKSTIHHLLETGINAAHIFYVSLDDYLLKDKNLIDIIEEYHQCHRLGADQKVYLFLDEITYKNDFRHQLKNLYDRSQAKIFVSSSSSSALRDNRGYLTGRERIIEILPLDFHEYCQFKKIEIKKRDNARLNAYFEDYMQIGGMPEYVINGKREYLTALTEDIIYKDIVSFHQLRNPHIIKDFFALLMERAGKQVSINKLANILGISVDTARRYLQMFVECYLVYLVPRFGKTNETLLSTKKIYAADIGIRNLFTGFRDKGAIFENIVYQKIKHCDPSYLYVNTTEIDFITRKKTLIEAKLGQDLSENQRVLFEEYNARKKLVIRGVKDLELLDNVE